uniref:Uncharacterized protein n=1 Tax=Rhizophora mucronata TaxID=61149 RepID=A0A2P2NAH1_RHIMU
MSKIFQINSFVFLPKSEL